MRTWAEASGLRRPLSIACIRLPVAPARVMSAWRTPVVPFASGVLPASSPPFRLISHVLLRELLRSRRRWRRGQ